MDALDVAAFVLIVVFSGMAALTLLANWPEWVLVLCVFGLVIVALALAFNHVSKRPDHLRARESDRILHIASNTVSYMRGGLTPENAQSVCEIILNETPGVAAVAITDDKMVLGFSGTGADHHSAGRRIVTRATHTVLEHNRAEVISTKREIGCPDPDCPLQAAIIVPLEVGEKAVGTLKYYYTSEKNLTETELAAAEGLARLLSTQLVIHKLEVQAALTTEMELKALQAQINPHFLFNTLNTISSYIRTDSETARHLLRQFAAFYRRTLQHGEEPITFSLEIEFLTQYFELEKARFGDQVSLVLDIDERVHDLPMPSFMIQPLVENSIAHGMRDDGEPLTITVSAGDDPDSADWLICVVDDGVGMPRERTTEVFNRDSSKGLGIALRNVADRLRGFYGEDSWLDIESSEGKGTRISFRIAKTDTVL
jgi:two-component system sensor histidine kinase LytS